jgi:hypothetical protein
LIFIQPIVNCVSNEGGHYGTVQIAKPINPDEVRAAITTLAKYQLHKRMNQADGDEAHRILPEIWPVINELCLIADACEAKMIRVGS